VISTDLFTSKVITIIDEDSTVSAECPKQGIWFLSKVICSLKIRIVQTGQYFSRHGYSGGRYDRDFRIGRHISKRYYYRQSQEVRRKTNDLNRYAIIEPAVDFKRLEEVFVLESKNNKDNYEKVGEDNK